MTEERDLDPAARRVLDFWFAAATRKRWFNSTPAFDRRIRREFEPCFEAALADRLANWERTAAGALALVVVLDQLPLNMYRGEPRAFAGDARARAVAGRAVDRGLDRGLSPDQKLVLYLPFMHSERLSDQDRALRLYAAAGLDTRWAEHHREIVRRFGRFPHRNAVLGRRSSAEELAYLASEGAFKG